MAERVVGERRAFGARGHGLSGAPVRDGPEFVRADPGDAPVGRSALFGELHPPGAVVEPHAGLDAAAVARGDQGAAVRFVELDVPDVAERDRGFGGFGPGRRRRQRLFDLPFGVAVVRQRRRSGARGPRSAAGQQRERKEQRRRRVGRLTCAARSCCARLARCTKRIVSVLRSVGWPLEENVTVTLPARPPARKASPR